MAKLAYLECPTGIAGDMCLGALVDAGVPLDYIINHLQSLGIEDEYSLEATQVHRNDQLATKVHVKLLTSSDVHKHHHGRHLPEIEHLIEFASLSTKVKQQSLEIFRQLAVAEAAVHGIAPEKVHFHEVGATDAIVDIVGTCLGLDWLEIDKLFCSPLPTGSGTIKAAHGILPVPAPAVLKLWELRQVPVYNNGIAKELVTPTGAAIATTLSTSFGSPPPMTIHKIGLGAGSQNLPIPNILRLWIGTEMNENQSQHQSLITETISVLETQIDDLSPQAIAYTLEQLLNAGALDVFTQSITMKKSRLGVLLTVICPPEKVSVCEQIIFQETTTLGIRHLTQARNILSRKIQSVETFYGVVRVKIATQEINEQQEIINIQPEYEDCATLARKHNLPWQKVHQIALEEARKQLSVISYQSTKDK